MKLLNLLLIICLPLQALTQTFNGKVTDDESQPLAYATVVLLSKADSLQVDYTITDILGDFSLSGKENVEYLLYVSFLGYESKYLSATNNQIVALKPDAFSIDEVTINANIQRMSMINGRMTINVASTQLSKLPDIKSIINRVPGVRFMNDEVSIIGKGSPEIYIDGRKIFSIDELSALQPSSIKSIEVDRSPSSQYSADVTSVIRITTTNKSNDNINLLAYNEITYGRKLSNYTGLNLNISKNKLYSSLSYYLSNRNYRHYSKDFERNYLSSGSILETLSKDTSTVSSLYNSLKFNIGYRFNDKNDLSIQYNSSFFNGDNNSNSEFDRNLDMNTDAYTLENVYYAKIYTHILSLRYELTLNPKHKITLYGDYVNKKDDNNQSLKELLSTVLTADTNQIKNKTNSNVYVGQLDYVYSISDEIKLSSGLRYSNSSSDLEYLNTSINTNDTQKYNNKIVDNISAAYIEYSHDMDNIGYSLGLRAENSIYTVREDSMLIVDRTKSNLFPSAEIHFNNGWLVQPSLSYTSTISRPTYSSLNPTRVYYNSYSYYVGNPNLKASISNSLDLNISFFDNLNTTLSYEYIKNAEIFIAEHSREHEEQTVFKDINIPKTQKIYFDVSYNNSWKWFSLNAYAFLSKPITKLTFLGNNTSIDILSYGTSIDTDFQLSPSTILSVGYMYRSKSSSDATTILANMNDLNVSVSQTFFKKKLQLNLYAYQLLKDINYNYVSKYGSFEMGQTKNTDLRHMGFKITYKFNNYQRSNIKQIKSYQELERL